MRLIDADALDMAFTNLRFNQDMSLAHWGDRKDWCLHGHEVEKLIHDAPTVGGWISVKDKLPEVDECVLVYAVRKETADALYSPKMVITRMSNVNFLDCKTITDPYWISPWPHFFDHYEITHWMSPKPPEEGKE